MTSLRARLLWYGLSLKSIYVDVDKINDRLVLEFLVGNVHVVVWGRSWVVSYQSGCVAIPV